MKERHKWLCGCISVISLLASFITFDSLTGVQYRVERWISKELK